MPTIRWGAIETLHRALDAGSDAAILTPQNGVGNEEQLAAAFGADRIVAGALTVPVVRTGGGVVAASRRGGMGLAPVGSLAHNWLVAAFDATAIPVRVYSDYRALKWSKLALNIIANAACAILNVLPMRLVRLEHAFRLEVRAIRETRAVMAALGVRPVDLPRYPIRALHKAPSNCRFRWPNWLLAGRVAGARGRKPPSLLLDLQAGGDEPKVTSSMAQSRRLRAKLARLRIRSTRHMRASYPTSRTCRNCGLSIESDPLPCLAEVEAEEQR